MKHFNRRHFLKDSMVATAASLAVTAPVTTVLSDEKQSKSPSEKLSVAVLGVRGRGSALAASFGTRDDCEITYVCEPDTAIGPNRAEQIGQRQDGRVPKCVIDMREVFDDPSVDIVVVTTPNHWHSLAAIWAMQAGKDVYVEKPVSHNVSEGRRMVQAMEKYKRICQGGTQYRSVGSNRAAAEYVKAGKLGAIKLAHVCMYRPRNHMGPAGEYDPPETVDYNLWAGPAPMQVPVRRPHFHYDWHWIWDYGNGELGNNSVHVVDTMRLILDLNGLGRGVLSYGARQFDDAGETPNTQVTIHDFGDLTVVQEVRNLKTSAPKFGGALLIEGTEGYMVGTLGSNTVFDPDGKVVEKLTGPSDDHVDNFIKAVRSREVADLNAPIHQGHVSTALVHVANISQVLGRPASPEEITRKLESLKVNGDPVGTYNDICEHLKENDFDVAERRVTFPPLELGPWLAIDADSESFIDSPAANALLTRDYREPFVVPAADAV
ncbi:MAG: Gfo/Idh/MocA family oxidoreductase [Thermoguttaceae bacterium]|jgi:predicted dehydrogenase|nr:Gfo/Idh/MocA family oxidoreductase [Thermoguttaceae bacterium]